MDIFPDLLELAVGQERSLTLPGLATAGYTWQARIADPADVIDISWTRGYSPGSEPARTGASAQEVATIRGVRPGQTGVELVQVRAWQPDAPLARHHVTVRVTET